MLCSFYSFENARHSSVVRANYARSSLTARARAARHEHAQIAVSGRLDFPRYCHINKSFGDATLCEIWNTIYI